MHNNLLNKLNKLGVNKKTPVAIAVSGGADSMALCVLCQLAGLDFIAIIVDHNFRKNSSKEAKEVRDYLAKKFGIKATILTNRKPIPKTNIEEFLRDVRYGLIFDHCKKGKINKILTAHHLDDQIETFLMRLERGAGLDGLTGMKETTGVRCQVTGKEFYIIRPLLSYTKDELVDLLKKNNIKWWEDESNKDIKLTRNNIRAALEGFSDYDLMRKRLSGVIENIGRAKNFIEGEKNKAVKKVIKPQKNGLTTLDLPEYRKLHDEIRLRILRDLVKKYSRTKKDVRMESIKNLDNNLSDKNFKASSLHGIKFIQKKPGVITFE